MSKGQYDSSSDVSGLLVFISVLFPLINRLIVFIALRIVIKGLILRVEVEDCKDVDV